MHLSIGVPVGGGGGGRAGGLGTVHLVAVGFPGADIPLS
jgi:hypothetical protein